MSRVGKHPVAVPSGVTVEIANRILKAKGKLGELSLKLSDEVAVAANKAATRRVQKAEEKVQGKALNKRLDDKYGRH